MVAFCSSRRQQSKIVTPKQPTVEALAACGGDSLRNELGTGASRRNAAGLEVFRDGKGEIVQVRIGRWRVLAAGTQRRLAEVRELACQRVAVRIERFADAGDRPSSEIWQLYDAEGRLEAALQTTPDGKFALLTNYQTRQACQLVRNQRNELETVESWSI